MPVGTCTARTALSVVFTCCRSCVSSHAWPMAHMPTVTHLPAWATCTKCFHGHILHVNLHVAVCHNPISWMHGLRQPRCFAKCQTHAPSGSSKKQHTRAKEVWRRRCDSPMCMTTVRTRYMGTSNPTQHENYHLRATHCRIKRGNSNQAVHTCLSLHVSVQHDTPLTIHMEA